MDSGNGPNQQQQQRYCPTPIMAPPSVAASPPIMTGGNVMSALHQPTHHPPPSISPHPGAYYGHHTTGTSHYPTPSPTPPPPTMHHQQYYPHSYYAHGSHQQVQQQQSQQSQHHAIANAHVPINTSPGAAQSTGQHSHMIGHGGYHHPQTQAHHQQWAAPTHPHQQQSHHYYHQQPTHHPAPQQQQPQQQHAYPPPPHSPYAYVQPHAPAPTPPPPSHTPHAQQQHLQQTAQPQQHQQQHPPPQVSVSPGPGQIHQTSPQQQQQSQSHALMNLSRFVSQQSPTPSPRASPNLAVSHHPQQMQQMGPTSPLPFTAHLEHHSMNGHTSSTGANNTPVMSPPPPPVPNQQPMSPTPTPPPVSQHPMIMQPQIPHNINGGEMLERRSPANHTNVTGTGDERERENTTGNGIMMKTDASNKERDLPNVFANITPSKIASIMNLKKANNSPTPMTATKSSSSGSLISQNNTPNLSDADSVGESSYPGISNASPVPMDGIGQPEMPKDLGDSSTTVSSERASCSPSKPIGSPSSSGNGHQMMPVRLQNMHKGARTKANMKKLMQEQQITTPNGQVTDVSSDLTAANAKDAEVMDLVEQQPISDKPAKSSRKKKAQKDSISSVGSNDSLMPMSPINMDLTGPGNSSAVVSPLVARPGYTKSGKKIGRPRKDQTGGEQTEVKPKKKRESKSPSKKAKNSTLVVPELMTPVEEKVTEPVLAFSVEAEEVTVPPVPVAKFSIKRKAVKTLRKRLSKLSSDTNDVEEAPQFETSFDLPANPLSNEPQSAETSMNESLPLPPKNAGKKRNKKFVANNSNSTDSPPDPDLNEIQGSKISKQEAESVALRVIQPSTTIKGKRKGKKSAVAIPMPEPDTEVVTTVRRSKAGSSKKKASVSVTPKEVVVSPDRGELPRLRSRSPKQRDSPPLRISSPRAAKERSTTPATTASQASTHRSRASKEKETASTVTTPLSSPSLRSPKKSPEKDKEKAAVRSSSRQKANEALSLETAEAQKEVIISPPLTKRSRQVSKESLDSAEVQKKGRRKPVISEVRLSSDSDRSPPPPIVSKRVSRRKSGSVTGSTDNLSPPSFNPISSSLSHIPSDGSLEMPSDFSLTTNPDNTSPIVDQQNLTYEIVPTTVPTTSKRRKPKKIGKTKSKSQRSSLALENASGMLTADSEPATRPIPAILSQLPSSENNSAITVKAKKSRKAPSKKGKRRSSTIAAVVSPPADSTVEENPGESNELTTLPVSIKTSLVTPRSRKGAARAKKQKVLPNSTELLNIPVPDTVNVAKKNVKFRAGSKTRKQSKKSVTKAVEESAEIPAEGNISIECTNATKTAEEPFDGILPQNITPSKRRRSSLASTTNTQVSAKSNTQNDAEVFQKVKSSATMSAIGGGSTPSNASKTLRRDSRTVSRDLEVSVVLTDIAENFTTGDMSLRGISTSLSRLQSPTTTFPPLQTVQSPPEQSTSFSNVKDEISAKIESPDAATLSPKKGKRKLKPKLDGEQPAKKKFKGVVVHPNQELQERKAILEAEVAQVLLDLKTGSSSSKSPSPAKSIQGASGDGDSLVISKKGKIKRRKSTSSPRRSIDNAAGIQESAQPSIKLELSTLTPEADTVTTLQAAPKAMKRKGTKARRSSNAKKRKMTSSLLSTDTEVNAANSSVDVLSQSLNEIPYSPPTSVKVAKTAVIPTASSFGFVDSPVIPAKRKSKAEKRKTPVKTKLSTSVTSPDITAFSTSSSSAVAVPVPKRKRKPVKKESDATLTLHSSSEQIIHGMEVAVLKTESSENLPSTSTTEAPPKKKRQRKAKPSLAIVEAVPSTSTALALLDPLPSTSKLFPLISPQPYKKPTVFSKSAPFSADAAKDDDNQKKKPHEAPGLRVLWGRSRFYRGGEEEEVDPDPKLPKEKTQLQTDNAVPWTCSLCHLGPHAQKLGDLFGPYFADLPSIYGNPSSKRETWMHGDCAVWAGRLLLIGTYLRRLEETLKNADKETCTVCGRNGATIGCLRRGCKEAVHYPCAVRKFWKMDAQNFHSYCPNHIP